MDGNTDIKDMIRSQKLKTGRPITDDIPKNRQFVKTYFDLLDSEEFRREYKSKWLLYQYMKRFIVRKHFEGDLGLYQRYWKEGYLAMTKSIKWLAEKFGMKGTTTIETWLEQLEADHAFETDEVHVGKPKPQKVYIFGTHETWASCGYREFYYLDDYNKLFPRGKKVGLTATKKWDWVSPKNRDI